MLEVCNSYLNCMLLVEVRFQFASYQKPTRICNLPITSIMVQTQKALGESWNNTETTKCARSSREDKDQDSIHVF